MEGSFLKVFLQEMTYNEVASKIEESAIVIIPVGSVEQHGLHLPLGTDLFIALEISRRVAEKTGSVVAPALWAGFSKEHMGFKGTISLERETLIRVMHDVAKSLSYHGFKKIVVLNAHGGNDAPLRSAVLDINLDSDVKVLYIGPDELFSFLPPELRSELEEKMDLHAGVFETSIINLIRPDLVRRERKSRPNVKFEGFPSFALELIKETPSLKASIFLSLLARFDEISDNGVFTLADPLNHWDEHMTENVLEEVSRKIAEIIEKWKHT